MINPVTPRRLAVVAIALLSTLIGYSQSSRMRNAGSQGFYTQDQAARGKAAYGANCARCHLESLKGKCDENLADAGEYICASRGSAPPLVGQGFLQRWHTVGDLYSRVKGSMPADHKDSLPANTNLAIVAYLLQANGLPVGSAPLSEDLDAMKKMVLRNGKASTAPVKEPLNDLGITEGYYTEAQAKRGQAYFQATCAVCHTTQTTGSLYGTSLAEAVSAGTGGTYIVPDSAGRGWDWGPNQHRLQVLAGDKYFLEASSLSGPGRPQRHDTVVDLFNKVRTTQPPDYTNGLSIQEYLDIVAYLLQQNGFPAGNEELAYNLNQMRNMTLEKGFERLFNGKDFTGWGFVIGANCSAPEGCALTDPGSTFRVENGMIANSGTPHGYMYTRKKFGPNFTFRAEYRNDPWPGMKEDGDYYGNSGFFLFINEHHVWPRTIEIQGRAGMEMWVNPMGGHATYTWDNQLLWRVRRPAGEWNAVQIVSKGNEVWNYLNGTLLSHISAHDFPPSGYVALQSESGTLHYRNIRIKPE